MDYAIYSISREKRSVRQFLASCNSAILEAAWGPSDCNTSLDFWLGRVQDEAKEYEHSNRFQENGIVYAYLGFDATLPSIEQNIGSLISIDVPSESFRAYLFWLGAPVGMED